MLKPKVLQALNSQLNAEYYSSYLYLSMSAFFQDKGLPGMANWMRIQADEEMMHAMKFFDYINERNGRVSLKPIDGPPTEWGSVLEVFEETKKHEEHVTSLINELVSKSEEEKDYATHAFLQWFINEQVEEEAAANAIVDQLRLVGDNGLATFMIDGQLGQRTAAPADPAGA